MSTYHLPYLLTIYIYVAIQVKKNDIIKNDQLFLKMTIEQTYEFYLCIDIFDLTTADRHLPTPIHPATSACTELVPSMIPIYPQPTNQ